MFWITLVETDTSREIRVNLAQVLAIRENPYRDGSIVISGPDESSQVYVVRETPYQIMCMAPPQQ